MSVALLCPINFDSLYLYIFRVDPVLLSGQGQREVIAPISPAGTVCLTHPPSTNYRYPAFLVVSANRKMP